MTFCLKDWPATHKTHAGGLEYKGGQIGSQHTPCFDYIESCRVWSVGAESLEEHIGRGRCWPSRHGTSIKERWLHLFLLKPCSRIAWEFSLRCVERSEPCGKEWYMDRCPAIIYPDWQSHSPRTYNCNDGVNCRKITMRHLIWWSAFWYTRLSAVPHARIPHHPLLHATSLPEPIIFESGPPFPIDGRGLNGPRPFVCSKTYLNSLLECCLSPVPLLAFLLRPLLYTRSCHDMNQLCFAFTFSFRISI